MRFTSTVAIDWSGAKGKRHKGIAIAEARGDNPPRLVKPGHIWSREEVLDWLLDHAGVKLEGARAVVERGTRCVRGVMRVQVAEEHARLVGVLQSRRQPGIERSARQRPQP